MRRKVSGYSADTLEEYLKRVKENEDEIEDSSYSMPTYMEE